MGPWFHVPLAVVVGSVVAVSAVGLPLVGIEIQPSQLVPRVVPFLALLFGIAFFKRQQNAPFAAGLWVVFWMGLVCELHMFPMFLAGRSQVPYQDELLVRMDQAIGLEVVDVLRWVEPYPQARHWLNEIYFTLTPMMTLVLLLTALTGRVRQGQEFVLSCVAAVLLTFPLFALFQAQGPWVMYGYEPNAQQREYVRVLTALKAEGTFVLDLDYKIGLITFPSFHTILAVLAGLGFWSFRWLRWPAIFWAALIVLSTMTTGWHYVTDVAAGLVIAGFCFAAAKGM